MFGSVAAAWQREVRRADLTLRYEDGAWAFRLIIVGSLPAFCGEWRPRPNRSSPMSRGTKEGQGSSGSNCKVPRVIWNKLGSFWG